MSIDLEQILRVDAGMTALSSYQLDLMRASGKLYGFDGASPNIDCDLFHRPEQLSSELGIRYSISLPLFFGLLDLRYMYLLHIIHADQQHFLRFTLSHAAGSALLP